MRNALRRSKVLHLSLLVGAVSALTITAKRAVADGGAIGEVPTLNVGTVEVHQATIVPVIWGTDWQQSGNGRIVPSEVQTILSTMVGSPLFSSLAQYSTASSSATLSLSAPFTVPADTQNPPRWAQSPSPGENGSSVPGLLTALFSANVLTPSATTMYVVFGTPSAGGGSHNSVIFNGQTIVFEWVAYAPSSNPINDLDSLTEGTSEELFEALTHPFGPNGWAIASCFGQGPCEIGDACHLPEGGFGGHNEVDGMTVQSYYSLDEGPACVVPGEDATWADLSAPSLGPNPSNQSIFGGITGALNANGTLEVFANGPDQQIWHLAQQTAPTTSSSGVNSPIRWSDWSSLTGSLGFVGLPTNTHLSAFRSPIDGHLEVFALDGGPNRSLHRFFQNAPNGVGGWSDIDADAPPCGNTDTFAVAPDVGGEATVFMVAGDCNGGNGTVWAAQPHFGFSWVQILPSGARTEAVAVGVDNGGGFELFSTDANGTMSRTTLQEIDFSTPSTTTVSGAPTAISALQVGKNADGRLEVFAISGNDAKSGFVHHAAQSGAGSALGSWQTLAFPQALPLAPGSLSVATNATGELDVFVAGATNNIGISQGAIQAETIFPLLEMRQNGAGAPQGWLTGPLGGSLAATATEPVAALVNNLGAVEVVTQNQRDNALWHVWEDVSGTAWHCSKGPGQCKPTQPAASATQQILNLNNPSNWTASNGSAQASSVSPPGSTTGSLAVSGTGYVTIVSAPLSSADVRALAGSSLLTPHYQLFIPASQPNPFWIGGVQILLSSPSANIFNAFVSETELTGQKLGQWNTETFSVPPGNAASLLTGNETDVTVTLVLNVNNGTGPWLMSDLVL